MPNVTDVHTLNDIAEIQLIVCFKDGSGQKLPLTALQGAYLAKAMGFHQIEGSEQIRFFSDKQLIELFDLPK